MHYTTFLLAALSTAALAAPAGRVDGDGNDKNDIKVTLLGDDELAIPFDLKFDPRSTQFRKVAKQEFTGVSVDLGEQNNADPELKLLRCKLFDENNHEIAARRGENLDVNFSDGGAAAEWTFLKKAAFVTRIECSPKFKKIEPDVLAAGRKVHVFLREHKNQHLSDATSVGPFADTEKQTLTVAAPQKNFVSVEVKVGKFTDPQTIRCSVFDSSVPPKEVTADRGENIGKTSFADGGNGQWTFNVPKKTKVTSVSCDPALAQA